MFLYDLPPKCRCGTIPTLRVRERARSGLTLPYVQYECPGCGHVGGLAVVESEARALWDDTCPITATN